jgi:cytochrome b561
LEGLSAARTAGRTAQKQAPFTTAQRLRLWVIAGVHSSMTAVFLAVTIVGIILLCSGEVTEALS